MEIDQQVALGWGDAEVYVRIGDALLALTKIEVATVSPAATGLPDYVAVVEVRL
jgi:hypothetical protein